MTQSDTQYRVLILWVVDQIVCNPACEVVVHSHGLQPNPLECRLYSIKTTGEIIKEKDPPGGPGLLWVRQSLVEEENDGIVHSIAGLICNRSMSSNELTRGHRWPRANCSRILFGSMLELLAADIFWMWHLWQRCHVNDFQVLYNLTRQFLQLMLPLNSSCLWATAVQP